MKRILLNLLTALIALGLCAAALFVWLYQSNRHFTETFYTLYSAKIDTPVRAVLLSDLHQAEFGAGNQELIARISQLSPDLILMAGDIVTADSEGGADYAAELCGQLARIAPVYYGLGNHENSVVYGADLSQAFLTRQQTLLREAPEDFSPLIQDAALLNGLEQAGVTVVQNSAVTVEVGESRLTIGGVSTNLSSFWPHSGQFITEFARDEEDSFKLLICHRPDVAMEYLAEYPIDLTVSGHTHGGIIRIPGKGGLLSTDGGLFPEQDAGLLKNGAMDLIISRGLGGHGAVPRVFNPPELVVIDLFS